jgi:hypothetical protein
MTASDAGWVLDAGQYWSDFMENFPDSGAPDERQVRRFYHACPRRFRRPPCAPCPAPSHPGSRTCAQHALKKRTADGFAYDLGWVYDIGKSRAAFATEPAILERANPHTTLRYRPSGKCRGPARGSADHRHPSGDPFYMSFTHLNKNARWGLALPPGSYAVRVTLGDPVFSRTNMLECNGQLVFNDALNALEYATVQFVVSPEPASGCIFLTSPGTRGEGGGSKCARLVAVEVTPLGVAA